MFFFRRSLLQRLVRGVTRVCKKSLLFFYLFIYLVVLLPIHRSVLLFVCSLICLFACSFVQSYLYQCFILFVLSVIHFSFIIHKKIILFAKGLKHDSVLEQLNVSLKRLKKDSVDLFYLHAPDHNTPIEETLEAVNHLYKGVISSKFKLITLHIQFEMTYRMWCLFHVCNKSKIGTHELLD